MAKTRFTENDQVFRELLKDLRMTQKLTQEQLAERLGQPQSFVSKYETGERRLDFVETVIVCEALGMSIEGFAAAFVRQVRGDRSTRVTDRRKA